MYMLCADRYVFYILMKFLKQYSIVNKTLLFQIRSTFVIRITSNCTTLTNVSIAMGHVRPVYSQGPLAAKENAHVSS